MIVERQCIVCQTIFSIPASRLKTHKALYCSKSCQYQGVHPVREHGAPNTICQICHLPFHIKPSRLAQGRGLYCSKTCLEIAKGWNGTPEERFWRHVDKTTTPDGCWPWMAYRTQAGYGQFSVDGIPTSTHVFAYELIHGPLLPGFCVCHTCDNTPCCRDEHLFPGTDAINLADMRMKGRHSHGEKHRAIMRDFWRQRNALLYTWPPRD